MKVCAVEGCDRVVDSHGARGMCSMHYKRFKAGANLTRPVQIHRPLPPYCLIERCARSPKSHGWCATHYRRWMVTGHPLGIRPGRWAFDDRLSRIFERVLIDDGCWAWTGAIDAYGYGKLGLDYAHRLMYELCVGPIPEGLTIDHLCRRHDCVRPAHLRAITRAENADSNRIKTHCPAGHEYDEANTYIDGRGGRRCRACARERARRSRWVAG